MAWIAGILGLVLFAAFISDAFEVMLLPRRVRRQLRIVSFFFRYSWRVWSAIASRIPAGKSAILDSCALLLTGFKGVRTFSARMTFPMARLAVVELSRVFRLSLGAPRADRLPATKFDELQDLLTDAGLVLSESESAPQQPE